MKRSLTVITLLTLLTVFSFGTANASGLFWFGTGYMLGNSGSNQQRTVSTYDPSIFWVADTAVLASVIDPLQVKVISCRKLPIAAGSYAVNVENRDGQYFTVDVMTLTPRSLFTELIGDTSSVTLLRVRQVFNNLDTDYGYVKYIFEYIDRPQPDPLAHVHLGTAITHK